MSQQILSYSKEIEDFLQWVKISSPAVKELNISYRESTIFCPSAPPLEQIF